MSGEVNLEITPRKRVVYRLCRCCNKFVPAAHHPYDLFGNKAKKAKIVELIVKYGGISIAKNDGCSEKICQICFSKVNQIHKLVNEFRDACIKSKTHQLSNCDRSKRCRRTQPRKNSPQQEPKKYCPTFRRILPAPSLKQHTALRLNNPTASVSLSTVKKRTLPFSIAGPADDTSMISHNILKSCGLKNPDVCMPMMKEKTCGRISISSANRCVLLFILV